MPRPGDSRIRVKAASAAVLATALLTLPAQADEVADFYKGKTITFTAASGVGGGYGIYAMLIREHFGKYVPGHPSVIVNYNPGGGGVVAADYHFNVAPKDGTAILAPLQSTPTLQLVGRVGIRYDASKFQWIGRAAETTSGFMVHRKVATTFDALMARKQETIVGVTQAGAPNHIMSALMGYCPPVKIRLVSGYKGSPPLALAFQRNEVDGLALPLDSLRLAYPEILKETMIAQSGLARARDFPDVPLTIELCKDPGKHKVVEFFQVQEEMGRSYALPPGTPPARVAALRKAFDAVMKDPALLAVARERRLEINPMSGVDLQDLVERHIATDDATVKIAKQAVGLQ
jgi:tripartite-type tricarboxylate transporter receptor subunit TctC